jgi:restriction endonuclease S subunit
MTTDLRPYPEYKDSGLPWLGDIPEHWVVKPLKRWVSINAQVLPDTTVPEYTFDYLDIGCVGTGRLIGKPRRIQFGDAPSRARRILQRGDTIISTVRTYLRAVWFVAKDVSDLVASTGFAVLSPREGIVPEYIGFTLQSDPFINHVTANSIGTAYPAIGETRLGTFHVALPPTRDEQLAIAQYLDGMDRKVRRFIRNRRRLIEVLNEQKQAIINRTITHGLDPNAPLKPSDIDWLGDIPEHWQMRRLKFLVRNVNEQTSTRQPDEVYIALEHVEGWTGRINFPNENIEFDSMVKRFQPDDVLFGKLRPYLAKVTRPDMPGVCVGEFLVLRGTDEGLLSEFLEQELRSKQFIDIINSSTFGAKMPRADWTFIGNLVIVYPPTHTEQSKILAKIDIQTALFQTAIDTAKREINLIREYHTRLIADVVTGKVDVRNLASTEPFPVDEQIDEDVDDEEMPRDNEPGLVEEAADAGD